MKTPEEIQELKDQWVMDPCWDIEQTEGFGDHFEELKAFREEHVSKTEIRYEAGRRRRFFEEPAFSIPESIFPDGSINQMREPGLSRREYFAAAAMQGVLASGADNTEWVARHSVLMADAVIKQLYENPVP